MRKLCVIALTASMLSTPLLLSPVSADAALSPDYYVMGYMDENGRYWPVVIASDATYDSNVIMAAPVNLEGYTLIINGDLEINNTLTFSNGTLIVNGDVIQNAGLNMNDGSFQVSGNYRQNAAATISGGSMSVGGSYAQYADMTISGGTVSVAGSYAHREDKLALTGGKLTVNGDYRLQDLGTDDDGNGIYTGANGILQMTDDNSVFRVGGDFYTQSVYGSESYNNQLSAGTLELGGNFTQIYAGNSYNFNCNGQHKVILSGTGVQTIHFENPGNSGFNILTDTNNRKAALSDVRVYTIGTNVTIGSFTQYGTLDLNGKKLVLAGAMTQFGDINVNAGTLSVSGEYLHSAGILDLNDGSVRVAGDYRLQSKTTIADGSTEYSASNGVLRMDNENDYFLAKRNFITQSVYGSESYNNHLSNGTLELKGNFTQINAGNSYNFNCTDEHKVVFSGSSEQTVTFEDHVNSGFNNLFATPNTLINLDNVRIKKIGSDVTVGRFTQYGTMDINGQSLTVNNSLVENGSITVNAGTLTVGGNLLHQAGNLDLDEGSVTIGGDYRIQTLSLDDNGVPVYGSSDGVLKMDNENDYLLVNGNFITQSVYGSESYNNHLSNGTMELKGNFAQINAGNSYNFNCTDQHKIIFSGDTAQTITFDNPGNSGFNNLYATPNTVVDITAARISKIGSNVTVNSFCQYGDMDINGYSLTILSTMTENGNIYVNGGQLLINGAMVHQGGALDLNDGSVTVKGNYRMQTMTVKKGVKTFSPSNGVLKMDNENDYLCVYGTFIVQSVYGSESYNNHLTNGTLELKGNFTQINAGNSRNFNATDNHKVIFSGGKKQTIQFADPGNSGFNILISTPNPNTTLSNVRIYSLGNNATVGSFKQYGTLDFKGCQLDVTGDMEQNGDITVNAGKLNVGGNLLQQKGSMDLDNGTVTVNGNYRIQALTTDEDGNTVYGNSEGVLKMNDENDRLLVYGSFITQSVYGSESYNNNLTNGTLELKGNFRQINAGNSYNFNCTGEHKIIFSGDTAQTITFDNPGNSGFNNLFATPNTIVDITAARISKIGSEVTVKSFTQYGSMDINGQKLTITEDLVQNGSITVNAGVLTVGGTLLQQAGTLDLDDGTVTVNGNYRIQALTTDEDGSTVYGNSGGVLKMDNENDRLTVCGSFITQSVYGSESYNNHLTNGVLVLKGDFRQINAGNSRNFNATDNHQVIFSGSGVHTIAFDDSGNSGFNILADTPNTHFNLDNVRIYTIGGTVTVGRFTQYGSMNLHGHALTVTDTFTENGSVTIDGGSLNVLGEYIHQGGTLDLDNGKVSVGSDYRIQTKTIDESGEVVYSSSAGVLKMDDPGDYFLVSGNFITQSVYGSESYNNHLTNGILEIKGGFSQLSAGNSYNFHASDNHITYFSSYEIPFIHFDSYKNSRFNIVVFKKNFAVDDYESTFYSNTVVDPTFVYNNSSINVSQISLGDSATVNLSAFGGSGIYQYTVYYKKTSDSAWTTLGSYTTEASAVFTPSQTESYDICVKARDTSGNAAKKYFTVNVVLGELQNNSTIEKDVYAPGETITVNCAAKYGDGSYKYAVYYKKTEDSSWKTVQGLKTNPTVTFKLTELGDYDICVKAADGSGNVAKLYTSVTVKNTELVSTSSVSANAVTLGTPVTVNAAATGGSGSYTYGIYYKQTGASSWTTVQGFQTNSSADINFSATGNYDICVKVKDSNGTIVKDYFSVEVTATAFTDTSSISADSISLGDTVTVNAASIGGTAPYSYAVFWKKVSASSWTTAQSFDSNATVSITPPAAGDYDICVKSKDSTGTAQKTYFKVAVKDAALKDTSVITADTITLGNSTTVKASATGGSGSYTYAVYYKNTTASAWTTVQGFSSNSAVDITPTAAGDYDICIKTKDSAGTVIKAYLTLHVTNGALRSTSTMSAQSIALGSSATVNASAEGGKAPYTYAVYYKNTTASAWTTVQGFSSNASVNVKPAAAGTYDICVKIKDSHGTIIKDYLTLTVS